MICAKMRHSPAPSMRAAWISSFGSPWMNWRIRNTPNGPAKEREDQAGNEFVMPRFGHEYEQRDERHHPGTIKVPSTRPKMMPLARERQLRERVSQHGAEQQVPQVIGERDDGAVEEERGEVELG
jgi:hypothetical protein